MGASPNEEDSRSEGGDCFVRRGGLAMTTWYVYRRIEEHASASGRARLLPSLFSARTHGSAGASPSLAHN